MKDILHAKVWSVHLEWKFDEFFFSNEQVEYKSTTFFNEYHFLLYQVHHASRKELKCKCILHSSPLDREFNGIQ